LREQFINKGIEIMNRDCLFCKIVNGDINADVVFESDNVIAFNDINPQAPTHILIIPKRHIPTINDLIESDCDNLGQLFLVAASIAKKNNFSNEGYRVVMNCNSAAGQTVFHLHLHLLGGRTLMWPPG
jgi:histidine triad (HIT) family protein